jgi:hypothetical protein
MAAWKNDELDKIGAADELELASARRDGTFRRPVTMWVVRDGDDLYVRSVNGRESSWFRGAQTRHEAHIDAGGVDKDVSDRPDRPNKGGRTGTCDLRVMSHADPVI